MLIGMSKTGVAGAATIVVPIMAAMFGGKVSAGLVLPMLCVADLFAVAYYHRHAQWHYVWRLLPWAVSGIIIGLLVGQNISDYQFTRLIAIIVLISVALMAIGEWRGGKLIVPTTWWFSALFGLVGGFATMIGNAAGGIMAVYLLSMHLPKNRFIGTGAWFFLIINLFKIPFHVFNWGTIDVHTFTLDLAMFPAIMIGAFVGVRIVKYIPEKPYRIFIIVTTALAAIKLFF